MLRALELARGMVSTAARAIGLDRTIHYDWLKADAEYAEQVSAIKGIQVDTVESKLLDKIDDGDITAIIFYLKCQGKSRGYIERTQIDISATADIVVHISPPTNDAGGE